jgi:hypothetical protein
LVENSVFSALEIPSVPTSSTSHVMTVARGWEAVSWAARATMPGRLCDCLLRPGPEEMPQL